MLLVWSVRGFGKEVPRGLERQEATDTLAESIPGRTHREKLTAWPENVNADS